MNPFEQQMQLFRDLMELNAEWIRKLVEFDTESLRKYAELSQAYVNDLPQVSDLQAFGDLQRDFGQKLWEGAQDVLQQRGELIREAVEANQSLWSNALSRDDAEVAKAA